MTASGSTGPWQVTRKRSYFIRNFEGDSLPGQTCAQEFCAIPWKNADSRTILYIYLCDMNGLSARQIEKETKSKNSESKSYSSQTEESSFGAKQMPAEYPGGDQQFDYAKRMAAVLQERCKFRIFRDERKQGTLIERMSWSWDLLIIPGS